MKAKNKKEFLELLGNELNRIGIEDTQDIFADFEEHFADSAMQGISEEETAERLGDIKEIARSYLNLESSRINSIIARDVEHKKGVSLTKPGRSVPADLSLLKGKAAMDSDCVRSYTPEHFSEEIYPNKNGGAVNGNNINFGGNNDNRFNNGFNGNAGLNASRLGNGNAYSQGGAGASANTATGANGATGVNGAGGFNGAKQTAGGTGEQTVADAFSNAGRAALDAAKVTGQAIVDAFGQSGVKDAVIGAGKSAAEAVKTAGHSAADAMKKAKAEHEQRQAQHAARQSDVMPNAAQSGSQGFNGSAQANGVPHPSDSFRENVNNNRTGTIPPQYGKAKTGAGYKMIDTSNLQPHLNVGKFILAILLDCFLWSWLIPAFGSLIIGGVFGGAIGLIGTMFTALFGGGDFREFYFLSRVFLTIGFASAAFILVNIGITLIKLFIKLFKFIINMHIRAIYDL